MMYIPWYMPPQKCPIALCPKVKEHLNKMEHLGVITHVEEPTDWASSITYVQKANGKLCLCLDPCDLNEAICHDHHKMPTVEEVAPMSLCTLTSSPSWMPAMDTGQLSSTRTPACLRHSTVPLEDTISCGFPLALSAPKTSSRRRWTRSSKSAKDVLELQMITPSTTTLRQNMMPAYETSCRLPRQIWFGV